MLSSPPAELVPRLLPTAMRVVERAIRFAQPVAQLAQPVPLNAHVPYADSGAGIAQPRLSVERGTERLTHPLEILLDSPRVLEALGGAVPLLALGIWYCVGDPQDQD
jgi:hypothetical protein